MLQLGQKLGRVQQKEKLTIPNFVFEKYSESVPALNLTTSVKELLLSKYGLSFPELNIDFILVQGQHGEEDDVDWISNYKSEIDIFIPELVGSNFTDRERLTRVVNGDLKMLNAFHAGTHLDPSGFNTFNQLCGSKKIVCFVDVNSGDEIDGIDLSKSLGKTDSELTRLRQYIGLGKIDDFKVVSEKLLELTLEFQRLQIVREKIIQQRTVEEIARAIFLNKDLQKKKRIKIIQSLGYGHKMYNRAFRDVKVEIVDEKENTSAEQMQKALWVVLGAYTEAELNLKEIIEQEARKLFILKTLQNLISLNVNMERNGELAKIQKEIRRRLDNIASRLGEEGINELLKLMKGTDYVSKQKVVKDFFVNQKIDISFIK